MYTCVLAASCIFTYIHPAAASAAPPPLEEQRHLPVRQLFFSPHRPSAVDLIQSTHVRSHS